MGLTEELVKFERKFIANRGWVKSNEELEMEEKGYKLVHSYIAGGRLGLERSKVEDRFGASDIEVMFGAYDHFACSRSGSSLYIKNDKLVIRPYEVVSRDWKTLTDTPFQAAEFSEIKGYAQQHQRVVQEKRRREIFKGLMNTNIF